MFRSGSSSEMSQLAFEKRDWDSALRQLDSLANHSTTLTALNHSWLGSLFHHSFPSTALSKEDGSRVLVLLCIIVRNHRSEDVLCSRFLQFLTQMLSKQQVSFDKKGWAEIVSFLLDLRPTANYMALEVLRGLSYVLLENGTLCSPQHTNELMEYLVPLASLKNPDKEAQRLAMTCLGNMCTKASTNQSVKANFKEIYEILLENFLHYAKSINSFVSSHCRMLSISARSLHYIILEAKTAHERDVQQLLLILKGLIFLKTPLNSVPFKSVAPYGPDSGNLSSDSDAEDGLDRHQTWKVRLHALMCVGAIAKVSPKTFYGYWSSFIPSSPHSMTPSLLSVILHDASPKVRAAATNTLTTMIDGSRNYLLAASESTKSASFTSFSSTLGAMLREIHNGLLAAIDSEVHQVTLIQVLKCVGVLVVNTPYEKLSSGLLTGISSRVCDLIFSESTVHNVRTSAIQCFSATMGTKSPSGEISVLLNNPSERNADKILIHQIMDLSKNPEIPTSSRSELFGALASIARNYYNEFSILHQDIFPFIMAASEDPIDSIRLGALKTLEEYCSSTIAKGTEENCIMLWQQLLQSSLFNRLRDKYHSVRSVACTCLSHVNEKVFESCLKSNCFGLILGMIRDSIPSVKAAACRTMGVYILLLPSQIVNTAPQSVGGNILGEVIELLSSASTNSNLTVRIRASWSMANFCDAFIKSPLLLESLSQQARHKMVDSLINSAKDNDKVRSNSVRGLGNFARVAPASIMQRDSTLPRIVDILVASLNEGSVKVQWNACYGIGNLFQNEYVQECIGTADWAPSLYKSLSSALQNCKNYKIRINAVSALAIPPSRSQYGSQFLEIWPVFIEAVETIDNISDFSEFKYKETLLKQLTVTIEHLLGLCTEADLSLLRDLFLSKRKCLSELQISDPELQALLLEDT